MCGRTIYSPVTSGSRAIRFVLHLTAASGKALYERVRAAGGRSGAAAALTAADANELGARSGAAGAGGARRGSTSGGTSRSKCGQGGSRCGGCRARSARRRLRRDCGDQPAAGDPSCPTAPRGGSILPPVQSMAHAGEPLGLSKSRQGVVLGRHAAAKILRRGPPSARISSLPESCPAAPGACRQDHL